MTEGAAEADEQLVAPLFEFRNYGQQLPHKWSTISNEAAFGTYYFTRTAGAKSNIFVNAPNETKYYYQDLDAAGARLNGASRYTVAWAGGRARRQAFLECPDAPHLRFVLVEAAGHLSDEFLGRITEHPRHRGIARRNHARPIDHQNRVRQQGRSNA